MILHSQTSATVISTPSRRRRSCGSIRPLHRQRIRCSTCDVPSAAKSRSPERIAHTPGTHVVSLRHLGGCRTPEEAKALAEHLDVTCVHGRVHGRTRSPACCDGFVRSIALPVIRRQEVQ